MASITSNISAIRPNCFVGGVPIPSANIEAIDSLIRTLLWAYCLKQYLRIYEHTKKSFNGRVGKSAGINSIENGRCTHITANGRKQN